MPTCEGGLHNWGDMRPVLDMLVMSFARGLECQRVTFICDSCDERLTLVREEAESVRPASSESVVPSNEGSAESPSVSSINSGWWQAVFGEGTWHWHTGHRHEGGERWHQHEEAQP